MDVRRSGGPRPRVTDQEILDGLKDGLNYSEIARRHGVTPQAISPRAKRLQEELQDDEQYTLPWMVRTEHSTGWVYKAAVAYSKRRRGEHVNPKVVEAGKQLEEFAFAHDVVLVYDYNKGFGWRGRRRDDGPSILAKS